MNSIIISIVVSIVIFVSFTFFILIKYRRNNQVKEDLKQLKINFTTKNDTIKEPGYYNCNEDNCDYRKVDDFEFGFERKNELGGFKIRNCSSVKLKHIQKTLVMVNVNNPFIIKTPFGKGRYNIEVGMGDCEYKTNSFPVVKIRTGYVNHDLTVPEMYLNNSKIMINGEYIENGMGPVTFNIDIDVNSDFIEIFDPRTAISGEKTVNEQVIVNNKNITQPTRITHIILTKK